MTKLESILKSRDITLPTKILIIKAVVFPVVMPGCESWTTKKAGHWCSRRLLIAPWTAKRSNQSVLREINPEYSLEKLTGVEAPNFGHEMQRTNSLNKTLMLGEIEGNRRRGL